MAKEHDVFEDAEHLNDEDLDQQIEQNGGNDDHDGHDDDGHDDDGHDDDGHDDDARVKSGEEGDEEGDEGVDPEREAIRARRREERRAKREAVKARENVLRAELAARDQLIENLTRRISTIEQRSAGGDISQIDAELNRLANVYVSAKQNLAKGTEEQDGRLVVESTETMQQVRERAEQLVAAKNAMIQRAQQAQQVPVREVDPRLKTYAERWLNENKWYNVNGKDEESRIVKRIDDEIAAEGYNPNSPEYWDELTNRVKKSLPKRFERSDNSTRRTPPVSGSSRSGSSSSSSQTSYSLSPERVAAMKEIGVWDDPKKRAAMIAEYKRYDKENGGMK